MPIKLHGARATAPAHAGVHVDSIHIKSIVEADNDLLILHMSNLLNATDSSLQMFVLCCDYNKMASEEQHHSTMKMNAINLA